MNISIFSLNNRYFHITSYFHEYYPIILNNGACQRIIFDIIINNIFLWYKSVIDKTH